MAVGRGSVLSLVCLSLSGLSLVGCDTCPGGVPALVPHAYITVLEAGAAVVLDAYFDEGGTKLVASTAPQINVAQGLYWLGFSTAGKHDVTVSAPGHHPHVVALDFGSCACGEPCTPELRETVTLAPL